jgi:outer membrane murein-binding lipoprotein Lpp
VAIIPREVLLLISAVVVHRAILAGGCSVTAAHLTKNLVSFSSDVQIG